MSGLGGGVGQEFCLKWNNHRTTILSVMDTLLEEESLVDVTLSADGQFIRAHRVILSACSPYFRTLFKSSFLHEKHPVIILKDVDFENLKSLVEYMYKGEANVPQNMLPSFISTAESLQVRGLAEGASKQKLEQVAELNHSVPHINIPNVAAITAPPHTSTPYTHKQEPQQTKKEDNSILAARLAKMVENPPMQGMQMFDFHQHLAAAARQQSGQAPPAKKPRKTPQPSPKKQDHMPNHISVKKDLGVILPPKLSPKSSLTVPSPAKNGGGPPNNNYESDSDVLKIDEDGDNTKENCENIAEDSNVDDIAELDNGNGLDDSEEEAAMPEPNDLADIKRPVGGFINPWTGEEIPGMAGMGPISDDHDEDSLHEGGGLVGWPMTAVDFERLSEARGANASPPNNRNAASPTANSSSRLKRLTNTDSVYTMCQTADGPKFQCALCARIFNLKCTLLRHVRHQHQGRFVPHPCKSCGQVFKRTDHLKVHMKKIHNLTVQNSQSTPNPVASTSPVAIDITPSVTIEGTQNYYATAT